MTGMALLRFLSASVEVTAALLMLRLGRVDAAFRINALLGLIGPVILIAVTAVGLFGLAGKISYARFGMIALGVTLILFGTRSSGT